MNEMSGSEEAAMDQAVYKVCDNYSLIKLRREKEIGAAGNSEQKMYVYDPKADRLMYRKAFINFTALKMFDEILVNAIDNMSRSKGSNKFTEIRVSFVRVDGKVGISVYNNGPSIRIEKYVAEPRRKGETDVQYQRRQAVESQQVGKYYPEVLFTVLNSSSNYNQEDDKTRITGGMNGIGAKLTAIFSSLFIIEVVNNGKYYYQEVKNGCEDISEPEIEDTDACDSVKITFVPDWPEVDKKNEFDDIDDDLKGVICKRVFDYCHLPIDLYINKTKLPRLSFNEFSRRHLALHDKEIRTFEYTCSGAFQSWKVAVAFSSTKNDTVSYVNNVVTNKGGQHVDLIRKQLTKAIKERLKKAPNAKSINTKLSLVVYAIIPGIKFESQAKTSLSNDKISVPQLSEEFINRFINENGILEYFETGRIKSSNTKAVRRRITTISKLRDAEEAGTSLDKRKVPCTLFICEGDSAQTLCDRGIKILGEKYYGSYALRGKPLNTLKATPKQYTENVELTELKQAIGLVEGKKYTDTRSLRYQRIVCCKDADYDGSAIMGLVINFFYQYFRELMLLPDFFFEFITPVITVYAKPYIPKSSIFVKAYYNLNEFKKDCEDGKIDPSKYYCKYIKGLGGNTDRDIEVYFNEFEKHLIHIDCIAKKTEAHIDKAYRDGKDDKGRKFSDLRKKWVTSVNDESYLPRDSEEITFNDFCDIDLALAGLDTCGRTLPSVFDGLKTSQRKVMYTFFSMSKTAASTSTKVFQITGKVADFAAYHHGDASLNKAITKMGQDFIGSNNIPLIEKDGQFGSRNKLGEDASAPRYIAGYLSPVARLIFPSVDDVLLKRKVEDNETVEPVYYVPIIPMLLINGTKGIATGWNTTVPMYNPIEILEAVREAIKSFPKIHLLRLKPWCRGWQGEVVEYSSEWTYYGKVEKDDEDDYRIVDIPIYMSIDELRENMNEAIKDGTLKDYSNIASGVDIKKSKKRKLTRIGKTSDPDHTTGRDKRSQQNDDPDRFEFALTFNEGKVKSVSEVIEKLSLSRSIHKNTLVALDDNNTPMKYASVTKIFVAWFVERRDLYIKRKEYILNTLREELKYMRNKLRFSQHVDEYELKRKDKEKVKALMVAEAYDLKDGSYKYLLDMPMSNSSAYKIEKQKEAIKNKELEIETYEAKTIEEIWNGELDVLEKYVLANYV